MVNGQIKVAGTTDNGTRIGCMKKFDAVLLLCADEDTKKVVVASAEELKGIKAKKIT